MKSLLFTIVTVVVLAIAMIGCSAPSDKASTTPDAPKETKADTKSSTVATTTTTSTAASPDKIGVTECDEYLTKYENCVKDKVPAAMRSTFEASMTSARNAYRTAAATPQGKTTLAQTCAAALETTKKSMASYNCTW